MKHPPSGVPGLIAFGFIAGANSGTRAEPREYILRTETVRIPNAKSLHTLLPTLALGNRERLGNLLPHYLHRWQRQGFIHGDLSPRNIILENGVWENCESGIWFIGWVHDLLAFEGTPRYCPASVRSGSHPKSFESDVYALTKIIKELTSDGPSSRLWTSGQSAPSELQ